jgi:hypothetical protein
MQKQRRCKERIAEKVILLLPYAEFETQWEGDTNLLAG